MSGERLRWVLIFGLASVVSAQNSAPMVSVTRWPQDRAAAISLRDDIEVMWNRKQNSAFLATAGQRWGTHDFCGELKVNDV